MKKLVIIFGLCAISTFTQATIRYVRPVGNGNGSSWANASNDLQLMIDNSAVGDEVWVAMGVYSSQYTADNYDATVKPPRPYTNGGRDNAFVVKPGVKIFGGFPATGNPSMNDRDWEAYPTILTGRIANNITGYHVVISAGNVGTACLDGFTITGGGDAGNNGNSAVSVNGEQIYENYGGGIVVQNSSPLLKNLIIQENWAYRSGAAIY